MCNCLSRFQNGAYSQLPILNRTTNNTFKKQLNKKNFFTVIVWLQRSQKNGTYGLFRPIDLHDSAGEHRASTNLRHPPIYLSPNPVPGQSLLVSTPQNCFSRLSLVFTVEMFPGDSLQGLYMQCHPLFKCPAPSTPVALRKSSSEMTLGHLTSKMVRKDQFIETWICSHMAVVSHHDLQA